MWNKGDKFIVEIGEVIEADAGKLYKIKNFNSLVFDDHGLNKLERFADQGVPDVINGLAHLARLLRNGAQINPGQKVDCIGPNGEKTECVVIETRPEKAGDGCVIVAHRTVTHYMPFSIPDKEHPYGWNNYAKSAVREYLRNEFVSRFTAEDLRQVVSREMPQTEGESDCFWLLSDEEVGGDNAFEWYQNAENRRMKDAEDDECHWFLRGAYPSIAGDVRYVYTSGALNNGSAGNACGLVAAWVIRYRDITPAYAGAQERKKDGTAKAD